MSQTQWHRDMGMPTGLMYDAAQLIAERFMDIEPTPALLSRLKSLEICALQALAEEEGTAGVK